MAKSDDKRSSKSSDQGDSPNDASAPELAPAVVPEVPAPGTTGRYLVLMQEDALQEGIQALRDVTGLSVASTADFTDGAISGAEMASESAIVFDQLAVCVVDTPPEQMRELSIAAAGDNAILAVEEERIVYAIQQMWPGNTGGTGESPGWNPAPATGGLPTEYLRGYRDAVNYLVDKLLGTGGIAAEGTGEGIAALDESELTWGLQVTKATASRFSGKGIRVAVLDTGLDLQHPDFIGRAIVSQSFVPNQAVQDGHGHGTHCIGTACGPRQPGQLPRYGVAPDAEIFAGKVLSNAGSGADMGILAGINWAMTNRCQIVSMSLGAATQVGQQFSRVYEQVARRALRAGTLIIAAAGNASSRPTYIQPVAHPANCPSIMAVAAVDEQFKVAFFSNGGLNPQGGQVDIAGPGVRVRSSWPRPVLYKTINGTSMATPHVAGVAALHAESNTGARGRALAHLLLQSARRLGSASARDVGAGLVQAP